MLKELEGKSVVVQMGSASAVTDTLKGKVISVDGEWIKLEAKKKVVYANTGMVGSISSDL